MEMYKCSLADCRYLAQLNKELIVAEGSDNPMELNELEERMSNFLQTVYEAYFFLVGEDVVGYALIKNNCEPLYIRQFLIREKYRRKHYGKWAFEMLLDYFKVNSLDIEVLSKNAQGIKFWESVGFVERHKYMRYE